MDMTLCVFADSGDFLLVSQHLRLVSRLVFGFGIGVQEWASKCQCVFKACVYIPVSFNWSGCFEAFLK